MSRHKWLGPEQVKFRSPYPNRMAYENLAEINRIDRKAKKLGLSYGKYAALLHLQDIAKRREEQLGKQNKKKVTKFDT